MESTIELLHNVATQLEHNAATERSNKIKAAHEYYDGYCKFLLENKLQASPENYAKYLEKIME